MKIAVVGTGYVGLVTGTCLAETGNQVICVDINEKKVKMMQEGKLPIYEPGLELLFHRNIVQDRLHFTSDLATAVANASGRGWFCRFELCAWRCKRYCKTYY
jgi:UDPglucose 6-dehydrogenase